MRMGPVWPDLQELWLAGQWRIGAPEPKIVDMKITHIGGPTAVISFGGLTFLTTPPSTSPGTTSCPAG